MFRANEGRACAVYFTFIVRSRGFAGLTRAGSATTKAALSSADRSNITRLETLQFSYSVGRHSPCTGTAVIAGGSANRPCREVPFSRSLNYRAIFCNVSNVHSSLNGFERESHLSSEMDEFSDEVTIS